MIKQRGFTLIEMAFVVAIVGLMVGGGLFAIGPVLLQSRINQTNNNMDQIESALILFAIRNSRLPCPADGSVANTSANYGIEVTQTTPGTVAGQCNMAAFNGAATNTNAVVPWRSLGLDETYSVDGWNNRIAYFPANLMIAGVGNLVDNNTNGTTNCLSRIAQQSQPVNRSAAVCDTANEPVAPAMTSGNYGTGTFGYSVATYPFHNYIAVYATTATGCGGELTQPNTNNASAAFSGAADNCTGVTGQVAASSSNVMYDGLRAAYVIISHGPSGYYAWTHGGTQLVAPAATVIKAFNSGAVANMAGTGGNLGFVQGSFQNINDRNSAGYFDDIVRWRSPAYIIQNCGGASCGNP